MKFYTLVRRPTLNLFGTWYSEVFLKIHWVWLVTGLPHENCRRYVYIRSLIGLLRNIVTTFARLRCNIIYCHTPCTTHSRTGNYFRPHRRTIEMRPIVTDRLAWSVGLWKSWALQNSWTDRDIVWVADSGGQKELCIRRRSISPTRRDNFQEEKGRPIVKCRLGHGL